jgi:hypothetical protein
MPWSCMIERACNSTIHSHLCYFTTGKASLSNYVGGWMCPRPNLDIMKTRRKSYACRELNLTPWPPITYLSFCIGQAIPTPVVISNSTNKTWMQSLLKICTHLWTAIWTTCCSVVLAHVRGQAGRALHIKTNMIIPIRQVSMSASPLH